jgi:2-haloacid dehalogenase
MNNLALLKAVTFDVFGTVVDWRTSIEREVGSLAVKKQFVVDGERFADAWRKLYQPSMKKVRDGEIPWTVLDDLHRTNLLEVLEAFGIDQLSEGEIEHLNRAWHRLDPWPDAVAGLQRLKQHYIIGTLSNGNVALIVNMAKFSGLPWDVVLGAEIAGHYKPQPEAYLKSAEILGLEPRECMLVAAHNGDLSAAGLCGFQTAFVPRPTEYGSEQTTDLAAEYDCDLVAGDFIELAQILGC